MLMRKRGRPLGPTVSGRRGRDWLDWHVIAGLITLPPTPLVSELAPRLGWSVDELLPNLEVMQRAGLVELWPDPESAGAVRVMLSAVALALCGLKLSASGQRWVPGSIGDLSDSGRPIGRPSPEPD